MSTCVRLILLVGSLTGFNESVESNCISFDMKLLKHYFAIPFGVYSLLSVLYVGLISEHRSRYLYGFLCDVYALDMSSKLSLFNFFSRASISFSFFFKYA